MASLSPWAATMRNSFSGGGTGSCPQPPQGWHRARRFNPIQLPQATPCVSIASKKYAEQVGVNRQPEPGPQIKVRSGENVHW